MYQSLEFAPPPHFLEWIVALVDVHNHGNISKKVGLVKDFVKEMLIDCRKDRTVISAIKINDCVLERVSSFKLLGLWIDDDLKWKTNTEYIVKNAAKRLHFLKILKGYNSPCEDLKTFYILATE